ASRERHPDLREGPPIFARRTPEDPMTLDEFDALFDRFEVSAFHLETHQDYAIEEEDKRLRAFREGLPRPERSVRTSTEQAFGVLLHFDDAGHLLDIDAVDDSAGVAELERQREIALAHSMSLAEYLAIHRAR
ncbi:MAG: DUF6879 family protein, partial [Gammaproteobacteria bacterium]